MGKIFAHLANLLVKLVMELIQIVLHVMQILTFLFYSIQDVLVVVHLVLLEYGMTV